MSEIIVDVQALLEEGRSELMQLLDGQQVVKELVLVSIFQWNQDWLRFLFNCCSAFYKEGPSSPNRYWAVLVRTEDNFEPAFSGQICALHKILARICSRVEVNYLEAAIEGRM